jgi:DNA-binding MarR family transcriptional regulator
LLSANFELEDYNMIDMTAKRVLQAFAETNRGEFIKGEDIHKKTGLIPDDINHAVKSLEKSLLIETQGTIERLPPYDFYAAQITDFGRQVIEQFG